jgi:hypothetical protein
MNIPSLRNRLGRWLASTGSERSARAPHVVPAQDARRASADLAPDERARRAEQQQRYERFAQHQMLVDAEAEADHLRDTH